MKKYLYVWSCQLHTAGALVWEIREVKEDEYEMPCACPNAYIHACEDMDEACLYFHDKLAEYNNIEEAFDSECAVCDEPYCAFRDNIQGRGEDGYNN
jgi:hypothetical protein